MTYYFCKPLQNFFRKGGAAYVTSGKRTARSVNIIYREQRKGVFMLKIFTKSLWIIASIVLGCVVILALILSVPKAAGIQPYVVLSGSMEPALQVGSVVWVDVRKTEAGIGDAVTFERDGRTVTHRIVGKTEKGYLTKGDANRVAVVSSR